MLIKDRLPFLRNPTSSDEPDFTLESSSLIDRNTGDAYPVINGMIDFQKSDISGQDAPSQAKGLMFKLNSFFSHNLEHRILISIFTSGGVAFTRARKKFKEWHDRVGKGPTLFLNPEDHSVLEHIGRQNCITLDDFAHMNVTPAPDKYPDVNAFMESLPFKTDSLRCIISHTSIEHVKHPRRHFREMARILRPSGHLLLMGPGDVYPTHRIPFNYFNTLRHGYHEMCRENDLEIIEEFIPAKSCVSLLYLLYTKIVRHEGYNTNQFTKLLHLGVFSLSVLLGPLANGLALLLDAVIPFDQKIYMVYMALIRKKETGGT